MEPDRYQQNHMLFILGMIGLVSSMILLGFSLYIGPPLIWGWNYHIPQFLWDWQVYLQQDYGWTEQGAAWLLFFFFLSLAIIAGIIAYIASNRIENALYPVKKARLQEDTSRVARDKTEIAHSVEMKIFFLIVLVVIGAVILQWIISLTA